MESRLLSISSSLVITSTALNYLMPLTRSLAKEIVQAFSQVKQVDLRNEAEKYHGEWFSEVESICRAVDIEPTKPRTCARQTHRTNIQAQTASEYYRKTITIPLLDHQFPIHSTLTNSSQ